MARKSANHEKSHAKPEVQQSEKIADRKTPARAMDMKHGRTENAALLKASKEHIPPKSTNQRHYNRRMNMR